MKVAVCDGCCADIERLVMMLRRYYSGRTEPVGLSGYFDIEDLLRDVGRAQYDAVFLSVGFTAPAPDQAARALRERGFSGSLFISGKASELFAGSCCANGFLPKPFRFDDLSSLLSGVCRPRNRMLSLKTGRGVRCVDSGEISYIESGHNCCTVHTVRGGSMTVRETMSGIEPRLGECFLRCHRSYIVNMEQIASAGDDFYLFSGDRVLIRRRERSAVLEAYRSFLKGKAP